VPRHEFVFEAHGSLEPLCEIQTIELHSCLRSSQMQDKVSNISYDRFVPLEVMFHLSPFSFTRGRAKAKCGDVLDGSEV
jgi:hypothetical protein